MILFTKKPFIRICLAAAALAFSVVGGVGNVQAQHQVFDKEKLVLEPFEYHEVKLQDSPLQRQFKEVEAYYLAISNNDLLKGFRERVGLPTQGGKDLGGWYSRDLFHVFGQLLGGMSRLYAVSGNPAMKAKVNTLVSEWGKTIEPDGFFFYSKKPWAPHYNYEKMVGGLVDAYVFTGDKEALQHLSTITDWAIKNLGRERVYGQTASEWYTLSENLYRAYEVTHDQKYLDFGKLWEYTDYWNIFLTNGNMFDRQLRHHAYSHLNTLSSAAAAYFVSGNEEYKTIIKNAYDYFQNEQVFATGGFGPHERLLPKDQLVEMLQTNHHSFETQCGSWAIFKLSKYLLEATGDARYGDWMEKMTINGIGANIPMSADGRVLYYSDYNPVQGEKKNYFQGWSCCTGTRPQAVAEYADLVYFKNKDGLFVNLYTPSKVDWDGLTVTQQTNFPESNQTKFVISSKKGGGKKAKLSFRNPGWAQELPVVSVNGKNVKPTLADHWLQLDRRWKNGDEVTITFPMQLAVDRIDESKPFPAALVYGPVAMAVNLTEQYPEGLTNPNQLSSQFLPVPGKPLNFEVKGQAGLTLRPYYQFTAHEPYRLYLDPAVKDVVPEKYVTFTGNWDQAKGPHFTNDPKASVRTQFNGTGIVVYLSGFKNSGHARIEIDGKPMETVDTYSPDEQDKPIEEFYDHLAPGKHEVVVLIGNDKNPSASNTFVNFTKFKIIR